MTQRHKRPDPGPLPEWVKTEPNPCIVSIAEDAYTALDLAIRSYGADRFASCSQLLSAGRKSLAVLNDPKASVAKRCAEGDRAARKFWEAKSCARQAAAGRYRR